MPILSVEKRITAGFTLAALVVSALGAISYTSSRRAAAAAAMERRSHQVEARLNGVLSGIADAESDALAFLITGDGGALTVVADSERKIDSEIRELRKLIVTVEPRRRLSLATMLDRVRVVQSIRQRRAQASQQRTDGHAVARLLRSDPKLRHVPIVAVTSYARVGDWEKVFAAGAGGYIEKPIDPETFASQIEEFLPAVKEDLP